MLPLIFYLSRSLNTFIKYLNPGNLTFGDFKILTQTAPSTQIFPYLLLIESHKL